MTNDECASHLLQREECINVKSISRQPGKVHTFLYTLSGALYGRRSAWPLGVNISMCAHAQRTRFMSQPAASQSVCVDICLLFRVRLELFGIEEKKTPCSIVCDHKYPFEMLRTTSNVSHCVCVVSGEQMEFVVLC